MKAPKFNLPKYSVAKEIIKAFWSKTIERESGCIEFKGTNQHGYGDFRHDYIRYGVASRWIYQATRGVALPVEIFVCHKCDNPACVNLEHLFLGTRTDNMRDAARKGRCVWQKRPLTENMKKMAKINGRRRAKINEEAVRFIRANYKERDPEFGTRGLGRKFGITQTTIRQIVKGNTWKDV